MSREIHFFDANRYTNYVDAKESGGIYTYDVSHADDSDNLKKGLLYEAILAIQSALACVDYRGDLSFALVEDGKILDYWR